MSAPRTLAERARAAYAETQVGKHAQAARELIAALGAAGLLDAPGPFRSRSARLRPDLYLMNDDVVGVVDGVLFTCRRGALSVLVQGRAQSVSGGTMPVAEERPAANLLALGELLTAYDPAPLPSGLPVLPDPDVPTAVPLVAESQ